MQNQAQEQNNMDHNEYISLLEQDRDEMTTQRDYQEARARGLEARNDELMSAAKALLDLLENWHPIEGMPARTEQAGKLRKAIAKNSVKG